MWHTKKSVRSSNLRLPPQVPTNILDLTLQEVRHQLVEQERLSPIADDASNISFVTFVLMGLEIEDAQ